MWEARIEELRVKAKLDVNSDVMKSFYSAASYVELLERMEKSTLSYPATVEEWLEHLDPIQEAPEIASYLSPAGTPATTPRHRHHGV